MLGPGHGHAPADPEASTCDPPRPRPAVVLPGRAWRILVPPMGAQVNDGSGDETLVEINVTPMVDVLLSLLIIFMVASPKPPNEKIPISVPKNAAVQQPSDPNATLLVTIEADGSARLGKEPLAKDYDQMVKQLAANEKAQTDGKIAIKGADKAKYGWVIRVMAAAHEAGIDKVGIASEKL